MAEKTQSDTLSPKEKFLKKVRKRLKKCVDASSDNVKDAIDDLRFSNLDQWTGKEKERRARRGRPMLVIDKLNKYIKQAVGDQRQNKMRIKVAPNSPEDSTDIATIKEGKIREIEYRSNFESITDQSFDLMLRCGFGGWRVITEYAGGDTFEQEIRIVPVPNPFAILLDPEAKEMDRSDARYGFVIEKLTREDFEDAYPKAEVPGQHLSSGKGMDSDHWYDKDLVTVAEYYEKEFEERKIVQITDGRVLGEAEAEEAIREYEDQQKAAVAQHLAMESQALSLGMPPPPPPPAAPELKIEKKRTVKDEVIKHYIVTYNEVIEGWGEKNEDVWPGKYIPLVQVYGEELNIDGKTFIRGLVRYAKDSQRLLNYWSSSGAEVIALAPKAPYIGTAEQFKGYEKDWAAANQENMPYLRYNVDPMAAGPPERNRATETIPAGIFQEIGRAEKNIDDAIGMAPADLGAAGPERSGAAVRAKQRPSDVVTFIYMDNLTRGVQYTGKILEDLIPKIHDTEHDAVIRKFDDTESYVPVNTTIKKALAKVQADPVKYSTIKPNRLMVAMNMDKERGDGQFNDLSKGNYAVSVATGPTFATQRAEAAENLIRATQYIPKFGELGGDLIIRKLDAIDPSDAEEFIRRYKKTLPPGMIDPEPGEQPPPQQPPPPQVQMLMQKVQLEQQKVKLEQEKINVKKAELQVKLAQLANEKSAGKLGIRAEIIRLMKELNAPIGEHPADIQMIKNQMPPGQPPMRRG